MAAFGNKLQGVSPIPRISTTEKESATERFFATVEKVKQTVLYLPSTRIIFCGRVNKHMYAVDRGSNELMVLTFRSHHPKMNLLESYVLRGHQPYIRIKPILDIYKLGKAG
ncbi:Hypothetical predicted protein [Lecanosticta acicola]|uniref:Uncharacterized protein n=1 Tax=Lecanosticta acicola TaxID=111012 RepID=A0AAI8Z5I5_9PEZI|nr:Hypothetical predicted protein [Lecanosticta acicola]